MAAKNRSTARGVQAEPVDHLEGLETFAKVLSEIVAYPIAVSLVFRWIRTGVRGHRIEARQIGRRWLTTRAALVKFARESGALPAEAAS